MHCNPLPHLVLRGLFGGAAVLCYFLTIEHLPVGIATLLNYTAPVFTAVWAALLLREPLDASAVGALALATCGVVLVSLGTSRNAPVGASYWLMVGAISAVLSGAALTGVSWGAWQISRDVLPEDA